MDCSYITSATLNDILMCSIQNIGMSYDIFALAVLLIFCLFAYSARLDLNISLALAWPLAILLYISNPIGQSVYFLSIIIGLLTIGVGIRVIGGFISLLR